MTTLNQVPTRFGVFEYPLDFLLWVRVPLAVVAALGILGIFLLAKRLVDERVAGWFLLLPDELDEVFAAHVVAATVCLGEFAFDDHLRRDARRL